MALGTTLSIYRKFRDQRTIYVVGLAGRWARCSQCGQATVPYACVVPCGPRRRGHGCGAGSLLVLACRSCILKAQHGGAVLRWAT
jgi:hypothetical protein